MARITNPQTGEVLADTKKDDSARELRTEVPRVFKASSTTPAGRAAALAAGALTVPHTPPINVGTADLPGPVAHGIAGSIKPGGEGLTDEQKHNLGLE